MIWVDFIYWRRILFNQEFIYLFYSFCEIDKTQFILFWMWRRFGLCPPLELAADAAFFWILLPSRAGDKLTGAADQFYINSWIAVGACCADIMKLLLLRPLDFFVPGLLETNWTGAAINQSISILFLSVKADKAT